MIGEGYTVNSDLYDISGRIKAIDADYFIFRRYHPPRYEVHHKGQRGSSLALVLPFDRLDARTLDRVLRTRREKAAALLLEAEKAEAVKEKAALAGVVKNAERAMETALSKV